MIKNHQNANDNPSSGHNTQKPRSSALLESLTIWPHRSLSRRGFIILMGVLAALLFAIGLGFFLAGAWPVIGFLGLELLVVWGAFKLNYQAAKNRETIETTPETLTIRRTDPTGKSDTIDFSTGWLRLRLTPPIKPALKARQQQQIMLSSHGVDAEVGAFLHPAEKPRLYRELDGMLHRSKAARDGLDAARQTDQEQLLK